MKALVKQDYSAIERAVTVGMTHGGVYQVETVVGVTQPARSGEPVEAHFCSCVLRLLETLQQGDGVPIRDDGAYEVILENGLVRVDRPAFVRFHSLWKPNGRLSILLNPRQAEVVWVPRRLRSDEPWAWQGGAEYVAEALVGSDDLDKMFERKGQLLL